MITFVVGIVSLFVGIIFGALLFSDGYFTRPDDGDQDE